jgi:type I restriction enzyme, S subunit
MWKTLKLGSLIDVVMGQAPPGKSCNKNGTGTPFVKAGEFTSYSPVIREWTTEPKKFGETGDVFLCVVGATCGKINFGENCAIGRSVAALRPLNDKIEQKYLYYFMLLMVQVLRAGSLGAAQTVISKNMINNITLSLPPLAEQQRIVAKLDAAFAEIDKTLEAVEENLRNSDTLLLEIINNLVNADNIGEETLLGEVCNLSQGLAINKSTKHLLVAKSSQPLLRIKDLISNSVEQYVDDSYQSQKTSVNEKDLIFTRTGSLGLVFRGKKGILHNNSFKVEPDKTLGSDYLYWWLQNPVFLKKIHIIASKAAQPDISHKLFGAESIRIPTMERQKEIVLKIECCLPNIKALSASYINKQNNLIALKSAILAQELQSEAA